jgi:hypothetical protein
LGLTGYYRKFIGQFSKIAKPLNDLQKKNRSWNWGPEQAHSFEQLKTALVSEPVLQYPDFSKILYSQQTRVRLPWARF